jgi:hypothetical protein
MIKYYASDIIKRATQLADLENSDFISFSEKIALLNEAYQQLYQKGINKGNNSFVRYINTKNKIITLPRDFYQLKAVTISNPAGDVQVINKRPANASFNVLSYEIINNTLQINGETSGNAICVEYFPIPATLTFPNKDKQLEMENVLDMHKDIYMYKYSTDNDVIIRSLTDSEFADTLANADYDGIASYLIHMEDDYITFSNSAIQILYNVNTGDVMTTNKPVVIWNNMTLLLNGDSLELPSGRAIGETLDLDLANCTINILSKDKQHVVGQNYNAGLFIDGVHQDFNATKMYYYNDMVYLSDGTSYLQVYYFDTQRAENTIVDRNIVSIVDIDDNTGYGYLGLKMKKYALVSFYDDTEMNFPNNTYFVLISYLLALAFKAKQGSDTTQLAGLTEQAENAFYDTLVVDDWNSIRVTNVY